MPPEELKEINDEINKILEKHNCDIELVTKMQIIKRDVINTETEKGSERDSGEPTK